jgi:hypothetical protein
MPSAQTLVALPGRTLLVAAGAWVAYGFMLAAA